MPVERCPTTRTGRGPRVRSPGGDTATTAVPPGGRGGPMDVQRSAAGPPASTVPGRPGRAGRRAGRRLVPGGGGAGGLAAIRPAQVDAGRQRERQGDRDPGQGCDPHPVHRSPVSSGGSVPVAELSRLAAQCGATSSTGPTDAVVGVRDRRVGRSVVGQTSSSGCPPPARGQRAAAPGGARPVRPSMTSALVRVTQRHLPPHQVEQARQLVEARRPEHVSQAREPAAGRGLRVPVRHGRRPEPQRR